MKNRSFFRLVILALLVTTFTCNLIMLVFLQRFFYGDVQVPEPESFYRVAGSIAAGNLGYQDYLKIRESGQDFEALETGMMQQGLPIYFGDEVVWSRVSWLSGGFYDLIGAQDIVAGKMFGPVDDEEGATPVAVVRESFWKRLMPGKAFEPGVQLFIKGKAFEVIGLIGNDWPYLASFDQMDIFIPIRQNPLPWQYETEDYQVYQVLARLDTADRVAAQTQVNRAMADIKSRVNYVYTADVLQETEWRKRRQPQMYSLFVALLGVTVMLFVLGVVNQFLMLVTRSVTIANDLKVMLALGASAKDVLKRFVRGLSGLMLLALVLVGVATVLCLQAYNHYWGSAYGQVPMERLLDPLSLVLLTVMCLFVLALHVSFPLAMYFLQGESLFFRNRSGGSGFSAKNLLSVSGVVLQIAMVCITVLGCVAFLRNLSDIGKVKASPYEDRVLQLELAFASKSEEFGADFRRRLDAIDSALMELGGVEATGTADSALYSVGGYTRVMIEGVVSDYDETPEWIGFDFITPGYFETVGLDFLEGQDFTPEQCIGWPHEYYIINEAYAQKHFQGEPALGQRIAPWDGVDYGPVIGVVENTPLSVAGEVRPVVYIPFYRERLTLHVRLSDASLVGPMQSKIEQCIRGVDPNVVIVRTHTVDTIFKRELEAPRLGFGVLLGLSLTGLVLSMSGIFGYQTYMITLRLREFAIKHALGLTISGLYLGEIKRGVIWALAGLVLGGAGFLLSMRAFSAQFFEIHLGISSILLTLVGLFGVFVGVVLLASLGATRPKLQVLLRDD